MNCECCGKDPGFNNPEFCQECGARVDRNADNGGYVWGPRTYWEDEYEDDAPDVDDDDE